MHRRAWLATWRRKRQAALPGQRQAHEAHPAKSTQAAWRASPMSTRSDEQIKRDIAARLARKLEDVPKSMAWILAKYRDTEGIDESAVARHLGIDIDEFHHLCMYGRPRQYLF